jgi:adenine phosphoribosyltransferase
MDLKKLIRDVPNFPKQGIVFKDITPLLRDADAFGFVIDEFVERYKGQSIDVVLGIESRGFILGPPVAYLIGAGFVPVRKKGKLPWKTVHESYELEYGVDQLEMHSDGIEKGQRVLILDDLLATGGTARAAASLARGTGGEVVGFAFLVELGFLKGREKLPDEDIFSLLRF